MNNKIHRELWLDASKANSLSSPSTVKSYKYPQVEVSKSVNDKDTYYNIVINDDIILDCDKHSAMVDIVRDCLKDVLAIVGYKLGDSVLVIGVGNSEITADSLGGRSLKYLETTRHLVKDGFHQDGKGVISNLASSVSGLTGLQSFEVISGVVYTSKPDIVIAVDTLSCSSINRLQKVIQISNTGITPGSGVNNSKNSLDYSSLGVPVIAIGAPLVIYATNIVREFVADNVNASMTKKVSKELAELVVTSKEVDIVVEEFAKIIGRGISSAIHKK